MFTKNPKGYVRKQAESPIKEAVLEWLMWKKIIAFPINNSAAYSKQLQTYLKPNKFHRKGVADILGIFKKRPLAIETKAGKNKQSPEQVQFQKDWEESGGIYILAKSVSDVEKELVFLGE